jgi:hypothetical protein
LLRNKFLTITITIFFVLLIFSYCASAGNAPTTSTTFTEEIYKQLAEIRPKSDKKIITEFLNNIPKAPLDFSLEKKLLL